MFERGGLNPMFNRYARANNKYMQSYDPSKPSTYLMYFDVNNLYGWNVSTVTNFRWVDNVDNFDVTTVATASSTCYILEVDLKYPQHLHTLIDHSVQRARNYKREKLLVTLYDKKRYVIHYHNLQ